MKTSTSISVILAAAMTLTVGACKKYDGSKAEAQRQQWAESLNDSIARLTKERAQDSLRVIELRAGIAAEIGNFTEVSNPREVEPYYILTAFRGAYPLTSTGIAARIMKSEQLELVAALSGDRFNSIRVTSGDASVNSATVPADQALNYTSGGLTTVAFSGGAADSICDLVARSAADPVRLEYLQNGAVRKTVTLSDRQKQWLGATWKVCGAQKESHLLEQKMLIDSRKIEILKITLQEQKDKTDNSDLEKNSHK